jgi:Zn-finger nucleic acid-binding protein
MDEHFGTFIFISYSGSDTDIANDTKDIMVTGNIVNIEQVEEAHDKQEEVSLLDAHDASYEMDPDNVGMGALANAAAEKVEAGAKRPGDFDGEKIAKKSRHESSADPEVWESLMTQVRGQLLAMSSDECFSKALELQMLARAEVGNRSQHLSNAMDMMANSQPGLVESPAKPAIKRNIPPNPTMPVASPGQRVSKAEREVSKQKPIKTSKAAPVPCMKMTPPLPPRCEVDNAPDVELPAFCQLVNFPTGRYYGNCVMCDESEFSIPKQNKGVCNNCDVAIWVVNPSGMTIKWCKGCKNFRKWVDFGMKGYSSKCDRCRTQQATRYANQKTKGGGTTDYRHNDHQLLTAGSVPTDMVTAVGESTL